MEWNQRPLFRNPHNLTGGGSVGMPIPGYLTGGEAENITFGSPAMVGRSRAEVQQEELNYEKLIRKAAAMYAQSDPTSWGYEADLHRTSRDISFSTAEIMGKTKEEVMEDLRSAIAAQRNSLSNGYMHGGIIGLEEAGLVPELFEGQEIIKTNPELNLMALEGNGGITSSRAAGAELPERNVPNEEGIIGLALDTEEIEVEDDNPMLAMAEQEAKGRLDEEFSIVKSTAQAEAATGEEPAFVIKRGMDDLARTAARIERDVIERYPEIPLDTNLIDSEDLVPYQEELVSIFQTPELGQEEFLMAENGGLIPGYQEGDLVGGEVVPTEWKWIDKDIRESGATLEEAEAQMVKRHGSRVKQIIAWFDKKRDPKATKKITLAEIQGRSPKEMELFRRMVDMEAWSPDRPGILKGQGAAREAGRLYDWAPESYSTEMTDVLSENMQVIKDYLSFADPEEFAGLYGPPTGQEANGATPAGPTTGAQGLTEEQINALIEAAISADRETQAGADVITEPSPKIETAKQAVTDLKEGFETQSKALEETFDVTELTALYKGEVKTSDKAIKTATTAITKAIGAQRRYIKEQEERIPELARVASMTAPATGGQATRYLTRKIKRKEIALNMRNKISGKNQALSAIETDLASLEKQAQEARRTQNVQALMDIKRQQINLIGELRIQSLGKQQDAQLAVVEAELNHQYKMDEIRLQLKKGYNQAMGIQFYNRVNEINQLLTIETDPDEIARLREEKDLIDRYSQGSSSTQNSIIEIMSKADDEEEGIAKVIAAHGMVDAMYYVHGIKMKKSFSKGAINTLLGLKTTEELVDATGEISFEEFVEAVKALSKNKDVFKSPPPSTMEDIALLWLNVS